VGTGWVTISVGRVGSGHKIWTHVQLCMKLFNTSDMQIVTECQSMFNFRLPGVIIPDRCETFRVKYESCNNSLYKLALSPL